MMATFGRKKNICEDAIGDFFEVKAAYIRRANWEVVVRKLWNVHISRQKSPRNRDVISNSRRIMYAKIRKYIFAKGESIKIQEVC